MTVQVGEDAVFTVSALGVPAPSYQWQRDGVDLEGATNASYTLQGATLDDDGARFRCVVTNSEGAVTSREALLRVVPVSRPFRRMDANGDGQIDIADAVFMLSVLFSGAQSKCHDAEDANDDGQRNIADPIASLGYLFA